MIDGATPLKAKGKAKANPKGGPTADEKAKTPCKVLQAGKCKFGDECLYKHKRCVAAAPAPPSDGESNKSDKDTDSESP